MQRLFVDQRPQRRLIVELVPFEIRIGVRAPHVAGNSLGGLIALELAQQMGHVPTMVGIELNSSAVYETS